MNVIVTYDIIRNHKEIKDELKQLGYKDAIPGVRLSDNSPVYQKLPNTTLLKYEATSTKSVCDEVCSIITKHNGGKDVVFCAELASNLGWNAQ
jgi:hypothetical protein